MTFSFSRALFGLNIALYVLFLYHFLQVFGDVFAFQGKETSEPDYEVFGLFHTPCLILMCMHNISKLDCALILLLSRVQIWSLCFLEWISSFVFLSGA
jgi:hypothetical protein